MCRSVPACLCAHAFAGSLVFACPYPQPSQPNRLILILFVGAHVRQSLPSGADPLKHGRGAISDVTCEPSAAAALGGLHSRGDDSEVLGASGGARCATRGSEKDVPEVQRGLRRALRQGHLPSKGWLCSERPHPRSLCGCSGSSSCFGSGAPRPVGASGGSLGPMRRGTAGRWRLGFGGDSVPLAARGRSLSSRAELGPGLAWLHQGPRLRLRAVSAKECARGSRLGQLPEGSLLSVPG